MIIVWRLLLAVYVAYAVACAFVLVRHDWRKGRRFTALRCLSIALFAVLWPIPAAIGLYVEHQVRQATGSNRGLPPVPRHTPQTFGP